MQTRMLGKSDLAVTPVGYGAWAIGGTGWEYAWGPQKDDDSIAAIHRSLELGVNWIDTAAVYGLGHSEEVVARALADWTGKRPYVFTKCGLVWDGRGRLVPEVLGCNGPAGVRGQPGQTSRRDDRPLSGPLAAGERC